MNRHLTLRQFLTGIPLALACAGAFAQTTSVAPPAGRLLASNCFQCHGYNGRSSAGFEILAGKSSSEIYKEMKEMQMETRPEMMDVHAKGYSDAQLKLIATYLSQQKP